MKKNNKNYEKNKKRKSYLLNKPKEITRRELNKKAKDAERTISNYQETKEQQTLRIEESSQEVKYWKERAEIGERDAKTHLEALTKTSKEWNERKFNALENQISDKVRELEKKSKEMEEKSKRLEVFGKKLNDQEEEIRKLQKELEDKTKKLDLSRQIIREQGEEIEKLSEIVLHHSSDKGSLSKEYLKRKWNNDLVEREEKKVKIEESRELTDCIEVPTKLNNN